jgi:GDP-D-mannose dehydratase
MKSRALIAGATALIWSNLAEHLLSKGWEVYGVSRSPEGGIPGVRPVAVDMLNPETVLHVVAFTRTN